MGQPQHPEQVRTALSGYNIIGMMAEYIGVGSRLRRVGEGVADARWAGLDSCVKSAGISVDKYVK